MAVPAFQTYKKNVAIKPGSTLAFTTGKGYYAKPGGAPAPAAPKPLTDAEWAQQLASQIVAPVQTSTTAGINQSAANRQTALTGATDELAKLMSAYSGVAGTGIDQSVASQSALNDAFASRLAGQGAQESGSLASQLASINADPATASRVAGQVAQAGTGGANAGYAMGAAGIGGLLADKAAASDYAGRTPGIAGLYGLQATQNLQGQTGQQLADAQTSIAQQRASLIPQLLGQRETTKNDAATLAWAKTQFKGNQAAAKTSAAAPDATLSRAYGYAVDSSGNPIGGKVTPLPGFTTDKSGAVVKKTTPKPKSAPKVNTTLSAANGYLTDGSGNAILKGGKKQSYTPPPSKSTVDKKATHGLTQQAYQSAVSKAQSLAAIAHKESAPGKNDALPWLQFLRKAQAMGVPTWVIIQEGRKVYSAAERKNGLVPKG